MKSNILVYSPGLAGSQGLRVSPDKQIGKCAHSCPACKVVNR